MSSTDDDLVFEGLPEETPVLTAGDLLIEDDLVIDGEGNEIVLPPTVGPLDNPT
jgi:hypothetical protein